MERKSIFIVLALLAASAFCGCSNYPRYQRTSTRDADVRLDKLKTSITAHMQSLGDAIRAGYPVDADYVFISGLMLHNITGVSVAHVFSQAGFGSSAVSLQNIEHFETSLPKLLAMPRDKPIRGRLSDAEVKALVGSELLAQNLERVH